MKKLLSTVLLYLIYTALIGVNCFGQVSRKDFFTAPKNDTELIKFIEKYVQPQINDTLITRLFNEADVVFEGEIVEITTLQDTRQNIYSLESYKIFKGGGVMIAL